MIETTPVEAANATPDSPAPESKQKEYVYDKQQKVFFLTINNPETYGYDHDKIIDIVHAKFKNVIYLTELNYEMLDN